MNLHSAKPLFCCCICFNFTFIGIKKWNFLWILLKWTNCEKTILFLQIEPYSGCQCSSSWHAWWRWMLSSVNENGHLTSIVSAHRNQPSLVPAPTGNEDVPSNKSSDDSRQMEDISLWRELSLIVKQFIWSPRNNINHLKKWPNEAKDRTT